MEQTEVLIDAIRTKKPISFQYNKQGKIAGKRIGNPHAIFVWSSDSTGKSTKVHIVQTNGVSDSLDTKSFPSFRMFNVSEITDISILSGANSFDIDSSYNSAWEGYAETIEKI